LHRKRTDCVKRIASGNPSRSAAVKRHPELRAKRGDINSSFHIGNNIWGRFGWLGIDCRLPPEVPTQIGGIDYRALVEPKVFIGATSFVFLRRAVAFVKR
jgi:hypothetical protein